VSSFYLYGITRPRGVPGRLADAGIRLLEHDGRAAVVSEVEPRPVEATRRNLLAHADVVEELHEEGVVLPARFGIVLENRDAVVQLLGVPEIEQLLEQHATTSELRLKGRYDDTVMASLAPAVTPLRDAYAAAPSVENGIALGEAVAAALADRRADDARRVVDAISPCVLETRANETAGELDAFSLALLVERGGADAVAAAVETVAADLSPPLHFDLVGPLPPYDFVDLALPALV
jgi:hypothetical protein